jgi:predicted PurR-regulated permease PerM
VPRLGSLVDVTSDSKVTSAVVYKAVLLAFGLVIAGMIFQALASLVLGVLIVVIIATPLSAFADMLQRRRIPRWVGATLGRLLGLAALGGVVARTVKLHPAVVAIGVVAVDQLFGFIGLLIAVPLIATVSVLVDELWVRPLERGSERSPLEQVRGRRRTGSRSGRAGSWFLPDRHVCDSPGSGSPPA